MGFKEFFNSSPDDSLPPTPEIQVVEKVVEKVPDHTHEWELTSKTYAAPRKDIKEFPEAKFEKTLYEKVLFGVTTLLWECSVCHKFRREEVLGTDENQLDEVLANAETLGPQYLERASGMYIVAKWQAAVQQPAPPVQNIPLR